MLGWNNHQCLDAACFSLTGPSSGNTLFKESTALCTSSLVFLMCIIITFVLWDFCSSYPLIVAAFLQCIIHVHWYDSIPESWAVVLLYLCVPLGMLLPLVVCILCRSVFLVLIWCGCFRLNIFLGSMHIATYCKAHVLTWMWNCMLQHVYCSCVRCSC
jgi:hypothetical protein